MCICYYVLKNTNYPPIYIMLDLLENCYLLIMSIKNFSESLQLIKKLKKLPDVKGENLDESNKICLICFNDITNGKILDCGHAYHYNCIKTWIQKSS